MDELVIQRHDFEEAKAQLKKFSEKVTTDLTLNKVNASKDVGEWFGELLKGGDFGIDHKVTGEEFNDLTIQVQNNLVDIKNMVKEVISEFFQVYSAFEALDKDYIQDILISIEATRKTNKKLENSQEVIKTNQADIKKAQEKIENEGRLLQKTIKALLEFKEKLDKYEHMADIDEMWNDIFKATQLINKLSDAIDFERERISAQATTLLELQEELERKDDKILELEVACSSKVKAAVILAGGSIGLAIIEFILMLTRMM